MARQPTDLSKVPRGELQNYKPYVEGDTWSPTGQTYTKGQWTPFNEQDNDNNPTNGIGATAVASAMGMAALQGRKTGDTDLAAGQRRLADQADEQAARAQTDAQRGYQLAGRDARVEGDKDAATRAHAEFTQKMGQTSAAAGGGAAVLGAMNVKDPAASYAEHRQRADTQHNIARGVQTQAEGAAQEATARRTQADEMNRVNRETQQHNNLSARYSTLGPGQTAPDAKGAQPTQGTTSVPEADVSHPGNERVSHAVDHLRRTADLTDEQAQAIYDRLLAKWDEGEDAYAAEATAINNEYKLSGNQVIDIRRNKNAINKGGTGVDYDAQTGAEVQGNVSAGQQSNPPSATTPTTPTTPTTVEPNANANQAANQAAQNARPPSNAEVQQKTSEERNQAAYEAGPVYEGQTVKNAQLSYIAVKGKNGLEWQVDPQQPSDERIKNIISALTAGPGGP